MKGKEHVLPQLRLFSLIIILLSLTITQWIIKRDQKEVLEIGLAFTFTYVFLHGSLFPCTSAIRIYRSFSFFKWQHSLYGCIIIQQSHFHF